ncbi:MAG: RsmG family class I SAM-dependent methyltransferase [Chloroflexota bacterium]
MPRDASGLPALDADAAEALVDGLRAMGLELTPPVLAAIDAHVRLLTAWGRHVNLTAIREPTLVVRLHVLDSLAAVRPVRERLGSVTSLVDIGSGGGYPGIPLALALGVRRLSLVDSVGRKARFLEVAGAATAAAMGDGAPRVEVLAERAETLAASARRATGMSRPCGPSAAWPSARSSVYPGAGRWLARVLEARGDAGAGGGRRRPWQRGRGRAGARDAPGRGHPEVVPAGCPMRQRIGWCSSASAATRRPASPPPGRPPGAANPRGAWSGGCAATVLIV